MPEHTRVAGLGLLLLGLLLVAGAWFETSASAALLWLAQLPAALGVALLRGSRSTTGLLPDTGRLALRWGSAAVASALFLGGPLWLLRSGPSLGHSLVLTGMASVLLTGLWWQWPQWRVLEALGGPLQQHAEVLRDSDPNAWHGLLQVALPLFVLLAGGVALAWPGLLGGALRSVACLGYAGLLPLAHALLQRGSLPMRQATVHHEPQLHGLPVVEMPIEDSQPVEATEAVFTDHPLPLTTEPSIAAVPTVPQPTVTPIPSATVAEISDLSRQLQQAARNGRVERALALLAAGADPLAPAEPTARDRRSVAVLAAVLPDLRLLRDLIARGVDVNAMQDGINPLLAATRDSWHGRPEAVMTLLANGANPQITDREGNTPLHHAARSSDPGVAALLRDAGADIDACNHAGVTPLGSACASGNWRLARFLLERGAHTLVEGGQPALLSAAAPDEDDPAGVQLLLRHKAAVNERDTRGRSALHEAAFADHANICQTLLAAGAEIGARDTDGRTPLLDAVRAGALHALEVLIAAGADVRAKDAHSATALHLACTADTPSIELVGDLRDLGLDPQAPDSQGRSSLDLAEAAGRWNLVALLDPRRALPAAMTDDAAASERPPLLLLREGLLEAATPARLEVLAASLTARDFDSLLGDAELTDDPSRLRWLLWHGANAEARLPGMPMPVPARLAIGPAGIPSLRILFASGGSPAGAGGLAHFLAACAPTSGAELFALELLERGADPFGPGNTGAPPLLHAVRLGWDRLLQRLLELGVDPNASDARGLSALHHVATLGRLQALKQLVMHGAAPDRRAADGQTALGIALASGRRELVSWLDWRLWPLPHRPLQPCDLPAAAIYGDLDAVRRLLELGLPINSTDAQGCTALLRAAGNGHIGLIEFLLGQGATPDLAANSGATPLSAAVSKRHLDIVDRLLQAGSRTEQRLPGEVTVLMLAAALGLPELVSRLLQAGADLNAHDAQGLSPLHCAAMYGFTERDRSRLMALLDALLLAGAEPQRAAANGATPLLMLLGARTEPGTPSSEDVLLAGVERFLDEDVRLDVCDARGQGPLHLAATHGLQRVTRLLLQSGADPQRRDTAGRTPRDVAQLRGYVEIAAELSTAPAATGATMSIARFLRE